MDDRTCEWCGVKFSPTAPNQIRCSHRCTRRAAKYREGVKRRGGELPASITCVQCGQAFRPICIHAKYCSPKCRSRGRNANRANRWKIRREEIFERDAWICRICTQPVSRELRHPHPWAATIDHIVPVSRGGTDDAENLQTAHMACNSSKGDSMWT